MGSRSPFSIPVRVSSPYVNRPPPPHMQQNGRGVDHHKTKDLVSGSGPWAADPRRMDARPDMRYPPDMHRMQMMGYMPPPHHMRPMGPSAGMHYSGMPPPGMGPPGMRPMMRMMMPPM